MKAGLESGAIKCRDKINYMKIIIAVQSSHYEAFDRIEFNAPRIDRLIISLVTSSFSLHQRKELYFLSSQ